MYVHTRRLHIGNIVLHMVNFMIMIVMKDPRRYDKFNSCIKGMCVMIFELEQKKRRKLLTFFLDRYLTHLRITRNILD